MIQAHNEEIQEAATLKRQYESFTNSAKTYGLLAKFLGVVSRVTDLRPSQQNRYIVTDGWLELESKTMADT